MKKNDPIRMCITCRKRESQNKMIRLQSVDGRVVLYRGFGRSFYLCKDCSMDNKKLKAFQKRFKLDDGVLDSILKEPQKNG